MTSKGVHALKILKFQNAYINNFINSKRCHVDIYDFSNINVYDKIDHDTYIKCTSKLFTENK